MKLRLFYSRTPKIRDEKGEIISTSVAALEKITLGGRKQSVLIRGHNKDNPLLLFLHGGPGSPELPMEHAFQKELEKYLTIVHWDQRGAGKSFSLKIAFEDLNFEQYMNDARELIDELRKRFEKKQIILAGHSWGTLLGMHLIHRYPELFSAYIGIGQHVDGVENEKISYDFVLEQAEKKENRKAIKQLKKLSEPPYKGSLKELRIQRKWLTKFGGWWYGEDSTWLIMKNMLSSPEYNLLDIFRSFAGSIKSLLSLWNVVLENDLRNDIPKVEVPIFICAGKYDYNTPSELAKEYFDKLEALTKEFIWFEKSAHSPNYEEPEKFLEIIKDKVLPLVKTS